MSAPTQAEDNNGQQSTFTRLRQRFDVATTVFYERVVRVLLRSIWYPVLLFGAILTVWGWYRSPGVTGAIAGLLGLTFLALGVVGIVGLQVLRRI